MAEFENPTWISVDKDGRVFVSDTVNERVRVLTPIASNACVFGLAPNNLSVGPAETTASLTVTASLPTCAWSAKPDVPWITASSTASGQVAFQVAANPATFLQPVAPGSFATIYSAGLPEKDASWGSAITDGRTLPTQLAGVRVRIGGKDCFLRYVGPNQVNALLPPDVAPGLAAVEVTNPQGVDRAWVTVAAYAPGWFTYAAGSRLYLAALFANEAALVSPSRPAQAGDYIQLYANGLGPTAEPYPVGQVLDRAYPLADLAKVQVTIGGLPAQVAYAGMVSPGLFQVNIRVPDNVPAGELPVVLQIEGQSTQTNALLPFASR